MVLVDNAELFVDFIPGVRPIVFVHGFAGDHRSWDLIWSNLAPRQGGMRYDLRGFGRSRADFADPYEHWRDLLHLLEALDVDTCDLVGVSLGGGVALNFALNAPAHVRRLVLISPAPLGWEWSSEWRREWSAIVEMAHHDIEQAKSLFRRHRMFDSLSQHISGSVLFDRSLTTYSGIHWLERDPHELLDVCDLDRVPGLRQQTLLLTGASDLEEFRTASDLILALAPHIERLIYPGIGHLIHLEAPVRLLRDISSFLCAEGTRPAPHG